MPWWILSLPFPSHPLTLLSPSHISLAPGTLRDYQWFIFFFSMKIMNVSKLSQILLFPSGVLWLFFYLICRVGIEPRASCILGKHSITESFETHLSLHYSPASSECPDLWTSQLHLSVSINLCLPGLCSIQSVSQTTNSMALVTVTGNKSIFIQLALDPDLPTLNQL